MLYFDVNAYARVVTIWSQRRETIPLFVVTPIIHRPSKKALSHDYVVNGRWSITARIRQQQSPSRHNTVSSAKFARIKKEVYHCAVRVSASAIQRDEAEEFIITLKLVLNYFYRVNTFLHVGHVNFGLTINANMQYAT